MIKRGKIDFSGTNNIFRISKPGIDVDAATADQLILDERAFYGQLYLAGFASNPSPGTATMQVVAFPSIGVVPIGICFPVTGGNIVYPARYFYKTGIGGALVGAANYTITTTQIAFQYQGDAAENGFYYMLFRRSL